MRNPNLRKWKEDYAESGVQGAVTKSLFIVTSNKSGRKIVFRILTLVSCQVEDELKFQFRRHSKGGGDTLLVHFNDLET